MERGVTFPTCGVWPITMLWVRWPIRADCTCWKEGLCRKQCVWDRAVRLIEIEIKSRFEIARFSKSLYSLIFFCAPSPNLPQYAIRTNQNAAEQNRPGIQTDSMLKKQGRWVQNRIRWPKKSMLHAEHTGGVAIIFPSEQRASFWRSRSAHTLSATP